MALALVTPAQVEAPFTIGCFEFHSTGVTVRGDPTRADWEGVFEFSSRANKYSGFWMVDLIAYVDSRKDWVAWRDQVISAETRLAFGSVKVYRWFGKRVPSGNRVDGVAFGHHLAVASLPAAEQTEFLEKSKTEGWTQAELKAEVRASKRGKSLTGSAPQVQQLEVVLHVAVEAPTFTKGSDIVRREVSRLINGLGGGILDVKLAAMRAKK